MKAAIEDLEVRAKFDEFMNFMMEAFNLSSHHEEPIHWLIANRVEIADLAHKGIVEILEE